MIKELISNMFDTYEILREEGGIIIWEGYTLKQELFVLRLFHTLEEQYIFTCLINNKIIFEINIEEASHLAEQSDNQLIFKSPKSDSVPLIVSTKPSISFKLKI